LKVLQICAAYKPAYIYGGPTMSVSMLSENLVKAGIPIEVYATTANGKEELPVTAGSPVKVDGVTVTYFKRTTKDHSHYSPALFSQLNKEAKSFSLVHIHAWWNLVSIFSCFIALKQGVPVLLSPRGTLSPYSFKNKSIGVKWLIHQFAGKQLLKKCHVHTTSQRESDAITKLFHPKSITVLPNFVKLAPQKVYPEREAGPLLKLLFFSRIEEKKGLDLLLSALPLVTTPYTLTIAGDGDNSYIESLKAIAANLHLEEKINWIGFQNENKFDLLQEHDLFVLPSHDENFGNVVIESLAVGTPVLISEQVGLVDYVQQNKLGWVCPTNAASISQQINDIALRQQTELNRIRKEAPGLIYKDFNDDNLVKRYIAMYDELLKQ
jgi:glycosyltransferase involved in cell wall biosynthesis